MKRNYFQMMSFVAAVILCSCDEKQESECYVPDGFEFCSDDISSMCLTESEKIEDEFLGCYTTGVITGPVFCGNFDTIDYYDGEGYYESSSLVIYKDPSNEPENIGKGIVIMGERFNDRVYSFLFAREWRYDDSVSCPTENRILKDPID